MLTSLDSSIQLHGNIPSGVGVFMDGKSVSIKGGTHFFPLLISIAFIFLVELAIVFVPVNLICYFFSHEISRLNIFSSSKVILVYSFVFLTIFMLPFFLCLSFKYRKFSNKGVLLKWLSNVSLWSGGATVIISMLAIALT